MLVGRGFSGRRLPSGSLHVNGVLPPVVKQARLGFDNNFPHDARARGEMHFQAALVQEDRIVGLQCKRSPRLQRKPTLDFALEVP